MTVVSQWSDELCLMCLVRALTVVSQWSDELCLMCLVRALTVVSQWSDELCPVSDESFDWSISREL